MKIFELNGVEFEAKISEDGRYLVDANNDAIYGVYFRGTGRVPQKYKIFLNSDGSIDAALFTHNGAIQAQESTLYGLWNDDIEKYKAQLTAANYQSYFDKTIDGQLAKAKKRVKMLESTIHDKTSQLSQLLDINEQMFDFIQEKLGRDEWIKWQESQK